MKHYLCIILFIICKTEFTSGQDLVYPNRPEAILRTNKGLITMVEYHGGHGLSDGIMPFSKKFSGLNVITGYQINRSFIVAAGTGLSMYNGGSMIPLFMDLRYTFYINELSPYLFVNQGVLMNISNFDQTVIFVNPGIGLRYSVTRKFAVNIATGIFIQSGTTAQSGALKQATFLGYVTGFTYKFWRKTNGYRIKQTVH